MDIASGGNTQYNKLRSILSSLFSIDARALGVYRMLLAVCLLIDLAIRAEDIEAFYTDAGVLPLRIRAYLGYDTSIFWTLHGWAHGTTQVAVAMGVAALLALLLLIGYQSRLMAVLSFIMLVSIQNRNPLISQGCDQLLRLMAFWAMFLPLNARYALDNRLRPHTRLDGPVLNGGTAALLLQVGYLYFFSGLLKTGWEWTTGGTAVWNALSLDEFAKPLGKWLLHFPTLLAYMTFMIRRLEFLLPILFFLPVFTWQARVIGVALVIVLQTGLGLTMLLGPFPVYNIVIALVFLPAAFWSGLENMLYRYLPFLRPREPEVFSAGEDAYIDAEAAPTTEEQAVTISALPEMAHTTDDTAYDGTTANAIETGGETAGPEAGEEEIYAADEEEPQHESWLLQHQWQLTGWAAVVCTVLSLWYNLSTIPGFRYGLAEPVKRLSFAVGMAQDWDLFAPYPFYDDGWFVMPARKVNGDSIDLWHNGAPLKWTKPAYVVDDYKNFRWQKYMRGIWEDSARLNQQYMSLLTYEILKWVKDKPDSLQINWAGLYFMEEDTKPPHVPQPIYRTQLTNTYVVSMKAHKAAKPQKKK